mgnify:CR=1 FL=1
MLQHYHTKYNESFVFLPLPLAIVDAASVLGTLRQLCVNTSSEPRPHVQRNLTASPIARRTYNLSSKVLQLFLRYRQRVN